MIKFFINLLKVIFKKKNKHKSKIKKVNEDLYLEKTDKGVIIHNFSDRELSPEEIINIVRSEILKEGD